MGRLNSTFAPLVNLGLAQGWMRGLMQSVLGVHRERQVLHYQRETFVRWWGQWTKGRKPATGRRSPYLPAAWSTIKPPMSAKVSRTGTREKNVHVVLPDQSCCGMPSFDIGDTAAMVCAAERTVASLKPWVTRAMMS